MPAASGRPSTSTSWLTPNVASSWGSFLYDAAEDALRVEVTPRAAPYPHWHDYEFLDRRRPDRAIVALQWEAGEDVN